MHASIGDIIFTVTICQMLTQVSCQIDQSVCSPRAGKGQTFQPLPALPPSYSTNIRWSSIYDHWVYDVTENFDPKRQLTAVVIKLPLVTNNVKLIYDISQGYISIFEDESKRSCQVHQPDGTYYTFNKYLWLTSLYEMTQHVEGGMDVKYEGLKDLNGVEVLHYSACLFEYEINSTAYYNMYYIDNSKPGNTSWVLPHVSGREIYKTFPYYITIEVKGPYFTGLVQGQVGDFDTYPVFQDEMFLPPPGTWCEGRPLTSLPALPTQFSAMSEVVDLDLQKVSYERIWFDSESKFVRWDWKNVDNTQSSTNPSTFSYIYDYNIGVKYSIDRNLETCSLPALIGVGDKYSTPDTRAHGPVDEFVMAESDVFFLNNGYSHQKIGRQKVRGVPCDVYVGIYLDQATNTNVTVQWYFSLQAWAINSDQALVVGSLYRFDVWKSGSPNPLIRNILEYSPTTPYREFFDVSMCYSATNKIHFVMKVKVSDVQLFPQVTRRVLKDLLISALEMFIVENNRFSPLELDYDGNQTLYVYTSLLERVPLDNTKTAHTPQHTMKAAFDFLEGSIRADRNYIVRTIGGQPVTLTPLRVYRIDFDQDFTTQPPTPPTTALPLIAPSKKHSTISTSTMSTTHTTTSTSSQHPGCNCGSSQSTPTTSNKCVCPKSTWQTCQPVCLSNNYCKCRAAGQGTTAHCPPCGHTICNCDQKCTAVKPNMESSHGSDKTVYSVGSLAGGMVGFFIFGLMLGFVTTRIYHVRKLPIVSLLHHKDDI